MGTILVEGLEILGVHGVLPEEQTRAQPFAVDLELTADLGPAGDSDDLADTIDYGAVIDAVVRVVQTERYQLLERLAVRFLKGMVDKKGYHSFRRFSSSLQTSAMRQTILPKIVSSFHLSPLPPTRH